MISLVILEALHLSKQEREIQASKVEEKKKKNTKYLGLFKGPLPDHHPSGHLYRPFEGKRNPST